MELPASAGWGHRLVKRQGEVGHQREGSGVEVVGKGGGQSAQAGQGGVGRQPGGKGGGQDELSVCQGDMLDIAMGKDRRLGRGNIQSQSIVEAPVYRLSVRSGDLVYRLGIAVFVLTQRYELELDSAF